MGQRLLGLQGQTTAGELRSVWHRAKRWRLWQKVAYKTSHSGALL